MEQNVNKYFTTKNIIFFVMIVLFLIFLHNISEIALMFFTAFILSAAIVPIVDKLSKKMPRMLAVAVVLFVVLLITFLIIVPLVVFSVKQGISVLSNLPSIIKGFQAKYADVKLFNIDISSMYSTENLLLYANEITTKLINNSVDFTKNVASIIIAFITVSIMVFYMCYDKDALNEWFVKLFPEKVKGKAENIFTTINERAGGFIIAQFLAMVFVGVATLICLMVLKNPNALILGFIAGVFDIVPVVGPTISAIIGILTAVNGGVLYIIATLVVYLLVQVFENQFLRPVIYGRFMNVHPLVIILSLLVGAKFLGFWGVVLGPAIASVICVLIDELYIKPINGEETNTENKE